MISTKDEDQLAVGVTNRINPVKWYRPSLCRIFIVLKQACKFTVKDKLEEDEPKERISMLCVIGKTNNQPEMHAAFQDNKIKQNLPCSIRILTERVTEELSSGDVVD